MLIVKDTGVCSITTIPTSGGMTNWDVAVGTDGKPTLKHLKDEPWAQNLQYQGMVSLELCFKMAFVVFCNGGLEVADA